MSARVATWRRLRRSYQPRVLITVFLVETSVDASRHRWKAQKTAYYPVLLYPVLRTESPVRRFPHPRCRTRPRPSFKPLHFQYSQTGRRERAGTHEVPLSKLFWCF
ncbi:hypothetical protein BV25DRAFT_238569 [Artomyces pyxidatus]|uniref:Uncharacterized protein n=1 Tax=Artomyces pyxidatus TaxID=48021 RepID=A0ACB8T6H8_9AGAM|nr:hypothetical protein BV25DRAFT_238569 [Artomyces pyxidatus]